MSKKKSIHDRRDAVWVRDIDPMHAYMAYLMPNRCEAEVFMRAQVDVTDLRAYIAQKNAADAAYKTTLFHAILMATAKTVYCRPLLNRFLSGRRFYQRRDITLSFVAKKGFTDDAAEKLMIPKAREDDTLSDITRRVVEDVRTARSEEADEGGADGALTFLKKLPRWMMGIVMAALRFMDRHDLIPASLTKVDPSYTTATLSNLGSIHCDAVYHHLNNFGTSSILMTIGEVHRQRVAIEGGGEEWRDVLELGVTLDERIADGVYFARSINLLKHYLAHPQLLDRPLKETFAYETEGAMA